MDLGVCPVRPNCWIHGQNVAVIGNSIWEDSQVIRYTSILQKRLLWQETSHHYLGSGLEQGPPSFEPAREDTKKLQKEGLEAALASWSSVVCGGAAHEFRFHASQRPRCRWGQWPKIFLLGLPLVG